MPLTSSILSNGLAGLTPTGSEATAAQRLGDAWETYWRGASISGVAVSGSTASLKSAFVSSLSGMSAPGAAAALIASAITTWWTSASSVASTLWVLAPNVIVPPLVLPPGLGGISAALTGLFASLTQSGASLQDAASQIAAALHAAGGLGAMATVQPPPPAPPIVVPIL